LTASGTVDFSGGTLNPFSITDTDPEIVFIDSNQGAGNQQTYIRYNTGSMTFGTRNSGGTAVTTDYLIGRGGGAGATAHIKYINGVPAYELTALGHTFGIGGTDIMDIDANGLNIDGRLVLSPGTTDLLINDTAGTIVLGVDNSATVANSELAVDIDSTNRFTVSSTGVNVVGDLTRDSGSPMGYEVIDRQTASTSSSLDFTGFDSSLYDSYLFVFTDIYPAADNKTFAILTSNDGGSTYDNSAANYEYTAVVHTNGGSTVTSTPDSYIPITSGIGTGVGETGASGHVYVYNPHNSSRNTKVTVNSTGQNSSGQVFMASLGAERSAAEDNDAVRFIMSDGTNISNGSVVMYGLRKS